MVNVSEAGKMQMPLVTYIHIFRCLLDISDRHSAISLDHHHPSMTAISPTRTSVPAVVLVEDGLGVAHEHDLAVTFHSVDFTPTAKS